MTNCEKLIVIIARGYVCFRNSKSSMLISLAFLFRNNMEYDMKY